jgi:hypothetical protein
LAYRGRRGFARYATAGRFWRNLLTYRAVTTPICQRSPQPLCEVPTLINGLDWRVIAKSARSEDNVFTSMNALLYMNHSIETGDYQMEKRCTIICLGLNYCFMGSSQLSTVPLKLHGTVQVLCCSFVY